MDVFFSTNMSDIASTKVTFSGTYLNFRFEGPGNFLVTKQTEFHEPNKGPKVRRL